MAKYERKRKLGASTIRVKKQHPTPNAKFSKNLDIFIGKPVPKHKIPFKLEKLLKKFTKNGDMLPYNQHKKKKENKRKTVVNGFTAFRTYYSRFGKSYKDQEELSKELAKLWNQDFSLQDLWHGYSEEYKADKTDLSFAIWFDIHKTNRPLVENEKHIIQSTTISHLVVEDVYKTH